MKQLVTDIITKLATLPGLKHVDADWGQLDIPNPPVKFPCALVDVASAEASSAGSNSQLLVCEVVVRVADMPMNPTSGQAASESRSRGLAIFDLLSQVHAALHGWKGGDHYGPLTRVSIRKYRRQDGIRDYSATYRVQLTDATAVRKPKLASAPAVALSGG